MQSEAFIKKAVPSFNTKLKKPLRSEDTLEDTAHDLGKKVGDSASKMAKATSGRYQVSRQYVKRHPTSGVLLAAGTGVAIGTLLGAAIRRKS
jgi:ElaB/YqjD/DUF883 family membrane-anchored ribosome-binding protein